MTEDKTTLPPPKKRYEWIDNARIVAALLIVYAHMPYFFPNEPHVNNIVAYDFVHHSTFYGRVPFFLILAGYFLARRITWSKAFDRALWLLIPFVIWNVLNYCMLHFSSLSLSQFCTDFFPCILGIDYIFIRDIHIFGFEETGPSIGVSWFLRDIIVLSLLTPILVRFKKFILLGLILVVCYPVFNLVPTNPCMLKLDTCLYYLLGVCLCDYRIDDAYRIFNKKFTFFAVMGFAAASALTLGQTLRGHSSLGESLIGGLFGAMIIAQSGVLIETYLPKFSKMLAPCGPACFLVFMLHWPIFKLLVPYMPHWLTGSIFIWLIPIPACALIIAFFLLMKKYTPWLMPYLGHMKVPKKQPVDAPAAKAS